MKKKRKTFIEEIDEIAKKAESEREAHPDDWIHEVNKRYEFKKFVYNNPGLTRFELARQCPLDNENDYDFRKSISYLKFTGEIYEDEDGFFYARNRESLHY